MITKIVRVLNTQINDFLRMLDFINPKFRFVFLGSLYIVVVFTIITKVSKNILQPTELEHYTNSFKLYNSIQDVLMMIFQIWFFYVAFLGFKEGIKNKR